ncbi:hypothetical cytosolic protein [Syntrophus aciditrophicus SB]|nr:hypothetical cytosolic protein [Syntrophus aciditrophicus SB]
MPIVSIHAPAWGATRGRLSCARWHCSFNPRPRMGGDAPVPGRSGEAEGFQSTPPHGGRRPVPPLARSEGDSFNPRPRMGGDMAIRSDPSVLSCFNPRPRMGGDEYLGYSNLLSGVSIHAPAWGATLSGHRQDER